MKASNNNIQFLKCDGEMSKLILEKDWSKTSLGNIDSWPQSLRTTLGIILNSKFPMFLWWGKELICFYNDAYRPSLGINGKHPSILGMPAKEAWSEVWDTIHPLIEGVLKTGESTWSENQLIPIYRNGKMEDEYWTFSHSIVNGEDSDDRGVLVTCNETTKEVKSLAEIKEHEEQLNFTINAAELGIWDLNPLTNKFIGNTRLKEWFGLSPNDEIELSLALNNIIEEDRTKVTEAIQQALKPESKGNYEIAYTIINPINKKTRVVLAKGKALFNADNIAYRFSGTLQDITEQTLTFKRVEDAEERLQIATDIIGIATWELDLKEYTLIHTSRLAEIFGQPKSTQITHEEMRSQIHPDDLKNVVDASFQQALKTGVYEYEARVLKPTFTTCWIRAQGKVFYDKNKQAIKIIGSIKEITDEKKQQQELLESEQKFRLLADSMPQFIWTSDAEGNLNYFSQSVYNYSGLTPEQINKEGWLQIVHPDEKDENISKWLHSVKTGEEFIFEHRFRRHDGEYRWQLSRAIPQRNEDGIIQKWVGTSTDIEDQKMFASQLKKQVDMRTKELKKLNEELIKSEVRYHLMVNEIQDYAIIFLNKDGVIENWNRGAKKIKGYDDNEIIGKNFSVFYTEEDRNTNLPKKLLEIALQTGKATHEGWRVKKDTSLFWAHIVITAIHDEKKNIIGFTKVTHDLTDKKQANDRIKLDAEQLELKNKELEKMNAELQSFAYVSSHDLQEPLRKIQTFATRILEKEHANLSDNGKNYFHRMQESANKMQTLIEDLLTYSRTNTTENIFKNTDLTELINEVKNDFKEVLAENHATIEIGEMCEAVIIPFQFRQIMQNLIGNSLKFAKPDVPPHIIIKSEIVKGADLNNESLSEEKNYCHISISDNGIGFDEQYKDTILEVFQRLHGKAEYKGTGIGLAIVKKIIENHNGIITASGKLNEGATFDIYIPSS